jgi:hypothetical protein
MTYIGLKYKGETTLDYQCNFFLMKGRRDKQIFSRVNTSGGQARGKGNEHDYGECILCSYMKTEE